MKRLLAILLLLTGSVDAGIVVASSPSVADLQTAQTAASSGDTIRVPAGDVTWVSAFTMTKNLTIEGAGVGQTIIRSAYNIAFDMGTTVSTVSGISFSCDHTSGSHMMIRARGQGFRITNCRFDGTVTKCLAINVTGGTGVPHPKGCIDSCYFSQARIYVQGDLSSNFGRWIWADSVANGDVAAEFGTENNVFIEDNYFQKTAVVGQNMIDHDTGGHSCIRYNTIKDATIHIHGPTVSIGQRATRFSEIYGNTIYQQDLTVSEAPIWYRGGTGVCYNNTITGTFGGTTAPGIALDTPRALGTTPYRPGEWSGDGNTAAANGTGSHDGAGDAAALTDSGRSWTVNAFVDYWVYNETDGSKGIITANTATTVTATLSGGTQNDWDASDQYKITNGYPLRDQPGVWKDSEYVVQPGYSTSQTQRPIYEWGNTQAGGDMDFSIANDCEPWLTEGVDYVNDTQRPGYTAYQYPHPSRGLQNAYRAKTRARRARAL